MAASPVKFLSAHWPYVVVVALGAAGVSALLLLGGADGANADDPKQVAFGRTVYAEHCAACHGENLEGQPEWRVRKADGKLPAPPHDETGHTWHHPDGQLFALTKHGLQAAAGGNYVTEMPAFAGRLSDAEIWAVLAYIKSRWPAEIRERQSARRASPDS